MATKWHIGQGWQDTSTSTSSTSEANYRQHGKSDQNHETRRPGAGDAAGKIAAGKRIYLGNLLYQVKPDEIEEMLAANGFREDFESIHISVDAITGRNPGYCFIDFKTSDSAQSALENLSGSAIKGRPVRVGPCKPKGAERAWKTPNYTPTFQRWGDWRGERQRDDGERSFDRSQPQQGPYKALEHLQAVKETGAPARVYLGGLGKMINQVEHDEEVRSHLEGFTIVAISKRIAPHPSTRTKPGKHHYCFVDFENLDDAEAAIEALDGKAVPGGRLRVSLARGLPSSQRD